MSKTTITKIKYAALTKDQKLLLEKIIGFNLAWEFFSESLGPSAHLSTGIEYFNTESTTLSYDFVKSLASIIDLDEEDIEDSYIDTQHNLSNSIVYFCIEDYDHLIEIEYFTYYRLVPAYKVYSDLVPTKE